MSNLKYDKWTYLWSRGIGGKRRRGRQRMRWLDGITDLIGMSLSKLRKLVMDREHWRAAIMRSQKVGHDWATELNWTDEAGGLLRWSRGEESTCQFRRLGFNPWVGKILWRRKWQSTSVFLPGAFHGQRSLANYSPRGCKELDTTEYARRHTHMK